MEIPNKEKIEGKSEIYKIGISETKIIQTYNTYNYN